MKILIAPEAFWANLYISFGFLVISFLGIKGMESKLRSHVTVKILINGT